MRSLSVRYRSGLSVKSGVKAAGWGPGQNHSRRVLTIGAIRKAYASEVRRVRREEKRLGRMERVISNARKEIAQ